MPGTQGHRSSPVPHTACPPLLSPTDATTVTSGVTDWTVTLTALWISYLLPFRLFSHRNMLTTCLPGLVATAQGPTQLTPSLPLLFSLCPLLLMHWCLLPHGQGFPASELLHLLLELLHQISWPTLDSWSLRLLIQMSTISHVPTTPSPCHISSLGPSRIV